MKDEDFINEEVAEEEDYEIDEELEPEMQGFLAGWKKAGRYNKKEKHLEEEPRNLDEEY